ALSRPFSLDLSQLLGALGLSGTLASVANSLVGVGASGTISVNASAAFHLRLGLDLNTVSTGTTTQGDGTHNEVQTVVLKATGGSFKLSFPFSRAPQNVAAAAGTGGSLSAGDRFYVITALIGGHDVGRRGHVLQHSERQPHRRRDWLGHRRHASGRGHRRQPDHRRDQLDRGLHRPRRR